MVTFQHTYWVFDNISPDKYSTAGLEDREAHLSKLFNKLGKSEKFGAKHLKSSSAEDYPDKFLVTQSSTTIISLFFDDQDIRIIQNPCVDL